MSDIENMATDANNAAEVQFLIQRVYVKDLSFEAPGAPAVFQEAWQPELAIDVHTAYSELHAGVYEVVLSLTVTVKNEKKVAFLVEIKQAGIFTIQGSSSEQLDHLLYSFCPTILFPYAREAVGSQVTHGSFPQLVLAPINFDMLYLQRKQQQAAELPMSETTTIN
ncbi:MAG: protein-export chaperone SecB [Legionellaceae bacterium]|nr:protein-export chaperone SecB [Legionellaceae bacterium]